MTVRERPGIFAEYCVKNSMSSSFESGITVGVAAEALGNETQAHTVTSYLDALEKYGLSPMTRLVKILMLNGALNIIAVPVRNGNYAAAFGELTAKNVDIVICDKTTAAVIGEMKAAVENTEFCMGIAEFDGTAAQCVSLAQSINSPRIVICGNAADEPGNLAAALAGAIAYRADPLMSFNGLKLLGCGELINDYTEQEIDSLIAGGVTPIEYDGKAICTVRGVTTKTLTDGVPDKSMRELNTALTANNVLKSVYTALKSRFAYGRNDELTRGAIRSQVVVELEKKLKAGIIEGYGNVRAAADISDPTVCNVSFEFTAAFGLNSIVLTAYLEV